MKITLEIPEYSKDGLKLNWTDSFVIKVESSAQEVIVSANKEGLMSLANHLLNLAQDSVPAGAHIHFDAYNSLEDGSSELVVQKI